MPVEILTYNPGFELTDAIGTPSSGWQAFFSSCTPTRVTTQFRSGVASAQLVAVGANSYIGLQEFWDVDDIDMIIRLPYTASWYVRVPTATDYIPKCANANGDWEYAGSTTAISANTWTQVTVPNVIPTTWVTNAHELVFRLDKSAGTFSGETIFYDDMSFAYESPAIRADYSAFPK